VCWGALVYHCLVCVGVPLFGMVWVDVRLFMMVCVSVCRCALIVMACVGERRW